MEVGQLSTPRGARLHAEPGVTVSSLAQMSAGLQLEQGTGKFSSMCENQPGLAHPDT